MNQHYDSALQLMEMCGGQFAKSLVWCYYAADPVNKAKLRETFAGYFENYEERFEQRAQLAKQQAAIDAGRQRQADEAARVEREKQAAIDAEARRKQEEAESAARVEAARIRAEQDGAIAEQERRERVQFEVNGPSAGEIIEALAERYDVNCWTVSGWLCRHVWAEVEVAV